MNVFFFFFLLPNRLLHSVSSCLSSSVSPSYLCSLCGGPAVSWNAPLRATCSFKATHRIPHSPAHVYLRCAECRPDKEAWQKHKQGRGVWRLYCHLSGALPARVKPSYHIDHTEQSTHPDTFVWVVRDMDRCLSAAQKTPVWLTLTCALLQNDVFWIWIVTGSRCLCRGMIWVFLHSKKTHSLVDTFLCQFLFRSV